MDPESTILIHYVTESPLCIDTESNYNTNNKTSLNKTSLRGEASLNASPSQAEILTCLD